MGPVNCATLWLLELAARFCRGSSTKGWWETKQKGLVEVFSTTALSVTETSGVCTHIPGDKMLVLVHC